MLLSKMKVADHMEFNNHLIIIVDDDKEDQKLITMALNHEKHESDSFEVATVSSPEEMLEKIKNTKMMNKYSMVILMDIKMPGKDGFDALAMIREDPEIKHLPVVMFSSTSSKDDVFKSYHLGANSFISKKSDYDELINDMVAFKKYWIKTVRKP